MSQSIELSLQWQDRILTVFNIRKTAGFSRAGLISIGGGRADVPVPGLGERFDLIEMGSVTKLRLMAGMEAEVGSRGEFARIAPGLREIFLLKDQTARLRMPGEKVSLVVRHAAPSPRALGTPLIDLASDEFIGLILALIVSLVLGMYIGLTPGGELFTVNREEYKITRAKFIFDLPLGIAGADPGSQSPAAPVKPANAKSPAKAARGDLLSTFASKGVSEALNKNLGQGSELTHMAGMATGRAGDPKLTEGGGGLKSTGTGAQEKTYTIENGAGRSANTGYSRVGGLSQRGRAEIQIGASDGSFAGGMDKEGIRRVIREHLPEIRNCYERALQAQPDLSVN